MTTSSKSAPLSADSSAAVSGSQCVLEVCSDSAGRPHAAPDADSGDRSLAIDLSLNPSVQGISGAEDQYPDRYDKSRRERELLDPSARTSNNFPIQSIESPGVESSYDCSSSPHFPIDSRAYSADEHVEAPHYDSKEYSKTSRGNSGDGSGDLGAGSLPPKESAISVVQVDLTGASTNYQTKRIVGGSTDASIRDTGYSDRPTQQFSNSYEKGIGDSLLKVSSGVQHLDSSGGESVDSAVEELKCDLKATSSSDQFLDKSVCSSVEAVNSSEGVQLHNEEGDAAPEPLRPGEENPRASHPLLRTDDIGGYANEECYQTGNLMETTLHCLCFTRFLCHLEDEDPVYCVILAGEYNGCISRIVAGPLSNGEYKMELIADDVSPAKSKDGKPVIVFLMKREFAMIDFEMKSEWTITVDGRMVTRKVFVPIIYDLQTEGVFYDSDFLIGSRAVVTVGFFEGFVGKLVCRYPAKDFYIIKLINENDTYFADSSTGSYLSLEIPSSGFVALDSEQNNGETNAFQSSECGIFSTPKYMSSMDFEVIKNNQDFLGCIDDSKIFSEKEIVSSEKVLDLVHILTGMLEGFVCRVLSTEENSLSIIPVNSDGSNPSEDLLNLLTTTVSPDDVEPVHLFVIEFLSGGIKHQCLSRDHSMLDTNGLQFFDNPATFDDSALPFSDSRCLASSFKRDCADSIDSHVSYTVDSDLVPGSYVKIHSGKYKECVGRILRSTDSHYSIKLINRDGKDYRNNTGQLVRAKLLKSNLTPLQLQLVGSNLVGDSSLTLKLQPDARDISFLFYEETVNEQKIPKRYGIIRNGPDNGCLVRIQKYLSSTNVEVLFCDERGETSESSNKLCLPRKDVQFVTVRLLDDVNEKEHERRENLVAYKIHGKENFSHLLAVIASASTHVKNNSNNKNDFLKNSALAQSPVARVKKRSYTGSSSASSQNVAVEERASELDEARYIL